MLKNKYQVWSLKNFKKIENELNQSIVKEKKIAEINLARIVTGP